MRARVNVAGVSETLTLEQLSGALKAIGDELARIDWRPALKQCAVAASASIKTNFAAGSAPDGARWPPLKHARTRNRRKGTRGLPLRDTGLLMASASARGASHVEEITDTSLEYGTALDYSPFHQEGTAFIPARPFVGVNERLADTVEQIVADHAGKAAGG